MYDDPKRKGSRLGDSRMGDVVFADSEVEFENFKSQVMPATGVMTKNMSL